MENQEKELKNYVIEYDEKLLKLTSLNEAKEIYDDAILKRQEENISENDLKYVIKTIDEKFLISEISKSININIFFNKLYQLIKNITDEIDMSKIKIINLCVNNYACSYDGKIIFVYELDENYDIDSFNELDINNCEQTKEIQQLKFINGINAKSDYKTCKNYIILEDSKKTLIFKHEVEQSLVVVSENIIGKMRDKLTGVFKRFIPIINVVNGEYVKIYDSTQNLEKQNMFNAGKVGINRMKILLKSDRIANSDIRI